MIDHIRIVLMGFLLAALASSATVSSAAEIVAGDQAVVDGQSIGILAGRLKPGASDGLTIHATFKGPTDIVVDSSGNTYVLDEHKVRKITPGGQVSTFAGSVKGYWDGPGMTALFSGPMSIAIDSQNNLFVADSGNRVVRKISPDGYVSTFAANYHGEDDGKWGPEAKLYYPRSIAVDAEGNVYVGDTVRSFIKKFSIDGSVTTLKNEGRHRILEPYAMSVDAAGNLYVMESREIKKVTPDGEIFVLSEDLKFEITEGYKGVGQFAGASDIEIDSDGNLYLSNKSTKTLFRISPEGVAQSIAENTSTQWIGRPVAFTLGAKGKIYFADRHNHLVHQLTPAGQVGPLPSTNIPEVALESLPTTAATEAMPELTRDEAKALFKETRLRAKKDPNARYELGMLYLHGQGVRQDFARARSQLKKAAKDGHAVAQYQMALLHLDGTVSYSLSVVNGDVRAAKAKQLAKRQANAAELLLPSAENGYAPAQYVLGHAYLRGEGVTQNVEHGLEYLAEAGTQGYLDAQMDLADIYRAGEIVEVDYQRSAHWYSLAAGSGDFYATQMATAMANSAQPQSGSSLRAVELTAQGETFFKGDRVPQDFRKALDAFKQAANLGSARAQGMLASMYLHGQGTHRNDEMSIAWNTVAAELGDADAQFLLGFRLDKGLGLERNAAQASHWYRSSAEQGNLYAQTLLARMERRKKRAQRDVAEVFRWTSMAAAQHDPAAQYRFAKILLSGVGTEPNMADGLANLEAAAGQGHPAAQRLLSTYAPAVAGDAQAQIDLARMYDTGWFLPENNLLALDWYTKAAEAGFADAQIKLGRMYRRGASEFEKDYIKSEAWFRLAEQGGSAEAMTEIAELKAQIDYEESVAADEFFKDLERLVRTIRNR